MSSNDLRRDARVEMRLPLVLFRGKREVAAQSSDVSFRGLMLLLTEDPPPLRSLVRLRVAIPSRTFDTHAMVVHTVAEEQGTAVGLQFWGLSGGDRRAWDEFINHVVALRRKAAHPAANEPPTGSGVRVVSSAKDPRASSK
jgi:hypothetical protein